MAGGGQQTGTQKRKVFTRRRAKIPNKTHPVLVPVPAPMALAMRPIAWFSFSDSSSSYGRKCARMMYPSNYEGDTVPLSEYYRQRWYDDGTINSWMTASQAAAAAEAIPYNLSSDLLRPPDVKTVYPEVSYDIKNFVSKITDSEAKEAAEAVPRFLPPTPRSPDVKTFCPELIVQAMEKFTQQIKAKVIDYLKLLQPAPKKPSGPALNDEEWRKVFIGDITGRCRYASRSRRVLLTPDDVKIWIENMPEIFTAQAIRNLQQHCKADKQVLKSKTKKP